MKKFMGILLSLTMAFGGAGAAFASEADIGTAADEAMIQAKIDAAIQAERQSIYSQLKAQDALVLMDVYEDIIYPQIEQQIREDCGMGAETRAAGYSYYAPNGGLVTYLAPVGDYEPTEVAVTCLDRDDSYTYLLNSMSFSMGDLLESIIGYIPVIGDISSILFTVKGTCDAAAISNIKDNDGYAQIINTYSREFGTKASVLTGWSTRMNITAPSNAMSVQFKSF